MREDACVERNSRRRGAGAWILILVAAVTLLTVPVQATMNAVEPATAKIGFVLTVTGANLGKTSVSEVYLTDGTHDYKATIVAQQDTSLKIVVPMSVKPGRLTLAYKPTDNPNAMLEQPVRVTIE
jgi:hypothetical protein